jgi:hypothetical protein
MTDTEARDRQVLALERIATAWEKIAALAQEIMDEAKKQDR